MAKLGKGEFEFLSRREPKSSTKTARNIFLKNIKKHALEVLKDLSAVPYDFYLDTDLYYEADENRLADKRTLKRIAWTRYYRPSWFDIEIGSPLIDKSELIREKNNAVKTFFESVMEWSKRHNLDAFWCREIAYNTIDSWRMLPKKKDQLNWKLYAPTITMIERGKKFIYKFETDYPIHNNRKQERELQIKKFEIWLNDLLDVIDKRATKKGYTKTPLHWEDEHFEYFAMYQCANLSYENIAKIIKKDRKTISEGVKIVAEICDLKIRKSYSRGRPKKS